MHGPRARNMPEKNNEDQMLLKVIARRVPSMLRSMKITANGSFNSLQLENDTCSHALTHAVPANSSRIVVIHVVCVSVCLCDNLINANNAQCIASTYKIETCIPIGSETCSQIVTISNGRRGRNIVIELNLIEVDFIFLVILPIFSAMCVCLCVCVSSFQRIHSLDCVLVRVSVYFFRLSICGTCAFLFRLPFICLCARVCFCLRCSLTLSVPLSTFLIRFICSLSWESSGWNYVRWTLYNGVSNAIMFRSMLCKFTKTPSTSTYDRQICRFLLLAV